MDSRFEQINNLLINYSLGNFNHKIEPTDNFDEIDAFICNINMLGEELKYSTISRDYFNNIFHSVSDMLFVLNMDGIIHQVNKAAIDKLNYSESQLRESPIDSITSEFFQFFDFIKKEFENNLPILEIETTLYSLNGEAINVICSCSYLYDQHREKIGYLLTARDQTKIKQYEFSLKKSNNRYTKIFRECSDAIFVIDTKGKFLELNPAGMDLFKINEELLHNTIFFNCIYPKQKRDLFVKEINENGIIVDVKTKIKDHYNNIIECLVSANKITDENTVLFGYHGIIKNMSQHKEMENLVIRTIVDTQEKERKRIVKDLHDSLGQQLSAIKFYLGALKNVPNNTFDPQVEEILTKSNHALDDVLIELWNICFDLMPGTLQNFGLKHAINELCKKIEFDSIIEFDIKIDKSFPDLDKNMEIAIFRIVQEFINNALKHGKAKNIKIEMKYQPAKEIILLVMKDNGKGFEVKTFEEYLGMGLKNIRSRISSYNGSLNIESKINSGTNYEVIIPHRINKQ